MIKHRWVYYITLSNSIKTTQDQKNIRSINETSEYSISRQGLPGLNGWTEN